MGLYVPWPNILHMVYQTMTGVREGQRECELGEVGSEARDRPSQRLVQRPVLRCKEREDVLVWALMIGTRSRYRIEARRRL